MRRRERPWAAPLVRLLAAARWLRATPLDPFRWTEVRRLERALPDEYRAAVETLLAHLRPENLERALAIASLPDSVRGYEELKLRRIRTYQTQLRAALESYVAESAEKRGAAPQSG